MTIRERLTLDERLRFAAEEMKALEALTVADPYRRSMLEDIEEREYSRAISKATGNYEPPDAPGWEGGFAENH